MQVSENIWLDDNTFIVDGVTMDFRAVQNLTTTPKKVSMSPNNYFLITEISIARRSGTLTKLDFAKLISQLKKDKNA